MNRVTRTLAMAAILLGQLMLSGQTFAMPACHGEADHAGMATSAASTDAPDADHSAHAGHDHVDADEEAGPASCQCAGSMHCGQLTQMMSTVAVLSSDTAAGEHHAADVLEQPSLAYRRYPDRPPA